MSDGEKEKKKEKSPSVHQECAEDRANPSKHNTQNTPREL